MSRPVWSGSISFGLVSVPVKAHTAVRDHSVQFHQIDKGSGARIRHLNVSAATGDPVERDDIVKGYEVGPGRYVTFEQGELEELRPTSTRAVEVSEFVALDEVDPIYYQRTYWLAPDGDAAQVPYALLLAAMEEQGRVAIGSVVMRQKQYLAAIRPLDGALAMSTMRFADEVIDRESIEQIPAARPDVDPKALTLAKQIIDSLESPWEPERYRDTYADQLREAIEAKGSGTELVASDTGGGERAEVMDLMAALRASVDAVDKPAKKRSPAKKRASADKASKDSDPADRQSA